ncbi:MAG: GntR family transcriptional regulator [Clostridium sp.]|nr:GntR family transcriptional regulator [Clostridium sp.]
MTKPRQKVLIYEQTVKNILNLIREEHLTSGDKLPPERELAQRLGVSRSCVREALQILAANDYLKIKRSSGIYINMAELPDSILPLKSIEDKLSLHDIQELLETRILLETYAIKQSAKIITQEQLQQLYDLEDQSYQTMLELSGKGEKPFGQPSIVLEHMLVTIQPNHYITDFHRRICAIWREYLESQNFVTMPPAKRHRDHLAILRAVSENSPSKIERYVSIHLMDTYDNISLLIEELNQET